MVALPLLVLLGIALRGFLATDDPRLRYSALRARARTILNHHDRIDFVVIGSSRTVSAVDGAVLAAGAAMGREAAPVIKNLSHPGRDDGHFHRVLQDLFSRNPVRQAVLYEYSRRDDRTAYYHYDRMFSISSTFRDLLDDFSSKPREPRLSRVRDLLELVLNRADHHLTVLLGDLNTGARWRTQAKRLIGKPDDWGSPESRSDKLKRFRAKIDATYGSWDQAPAATLNLDDIQEDRANHYIRKTIALCRERDTPLIFFNTPAYLDAPLGEEAKSAFMQRFGQPLLTPPAEVLAQLYDGKNYSDQAHLNRRGGRKIYSAWLTGALQDQLQREPR